MPRITHLTDKQIVISRLVETTPNKLVMSTVTADFAHIQPDTNYKSQLTDGVFGKRFRAYVDGATDIQEGDRIRDQDGITYNVISDGVSRRLYGSFDHKEIILEKTK